MYKSSSAWRTVATATVRHAIPRGGTSSLHEVGETAALRHVVPDERNIGRSGSHAGVAKHHHGLQRLALREALVVEVATDLPEPTTGAVVDLRRGEVGVHARQVDEVRVVGIGGIAVDHRELPVFLAGLVGDELVLRLHDLRTGAVAVDVGVLLESRHAVLHEHVDGTVPARRQLVDVTVGNARLAIVLGAVEDGTGSLVLAERGHRQVRVEVPVLVGHTRDRLVVGGRDGGRRGPEHGPRLGETRHHHEGDEQDSAQNEGHVGRSLRVGHDFPLLIVRDHAPYF